MKNPFTRGFAILALSSLMFVQIAQATLTETQDPYTDDSAISVILSGSLNSEGKVDLSWTQYIGENFQWYKVVHSQTNQSPKYPTDGYIDVKTTAADTTYTHTSVPAGTNYYSVCVITTDSKRGCSNTLTITKEGDSSVTEEPVSNDPYTDDSSIVITLNGKLTSEGKAALTWTKYSGTDLKWYKIVHSQTNDSAYYPVDGYIEVYSDPAVTTYTHESVPEGTNYYRVCVITTADKRGCSNTVTLTKGEGTATTTEAAFPDIEDHWAKDYITELYNDGVVEGRDGNFVPNDPVLRSEGVKMVILGLGFQPLECDSSLFPDLKAGDWFCGVVTKAYVLGVIEGDDGYLFPTRDITRAEALKILLSSKGYEPPTIETAPFSDVQPSDWYAGYVYKAKLLGWVEGIDGKFEPNRFITRAELAKLVSLAK